MKLLTFCFSLLTTVSAFANPFSNFLGTFNVTGSPQVAMDGMSYCNWQGFRQITGLVISEQNGTYVAPHDKSTSDKNFENNWTTKGNENLRTGAEGTRASKPQK